MDGIATQFGMLPQPAGGGGTGGSEVSFIEDIGRYYGSPITSRSETINIGDSDPNRWIVVTVSWRSFNASNTPNAAASFEGVAMSKLLSGNFASNFCVTSIFWLKVPTGTSGSFSISFNNAAAASSHISVYRVVAPSFSLGDYTLENGSSISTTIITNNPSLVFACYGVRNSSPGPEITGIDSYASYFYNNILAAQSGFKQITSASASYALSVPPIPIDYGYAFAAASFDI